MVHPLRAQAIDPGFTEGDCAYHAVLAAGNGRVYFAIGSHRSDCHARLACYDPAAGQIAFVRDLGETLDEPGVPRAIPHGKVHVPLAESHGRVYLATMQGYYGRDRAGLGTYPGFRILAADLESGALVNVARGPARQGMVTGILDTSRRIYSGLLYPSGRFCRCDLESGRVDVLRRPCADWVLAGRIRLRVAYPVCRSLGLDAEGAVYGSCRSGVVWRAAPGGAPAVVPDVNVREGALGPVDRRGGRENFWRVVLWEPHERVFYGVHAGTQSLFRFDPDRRRIEPLARIGHPAFHASGHAPHGSQLGLTLGPHRMIYHVVHGPRPGQEAAPGVAAWLTSFHLDERVFRCHGPLETHVGERVLFAESLTSDGNGHLYSVAWVEPRYAADRERLRRLRAHASPPATRDCGYRIQLLRIDAGSTSMTT
jgi:hypothetical protein